MHDIVIFCYTNGILNPNYTSSLLEVERLCVLLLKIERKNSNLLKIENQKNVIYDDASIRGIRDL